MSSPETFDAFYNRLTGTGGWSTTPIRFENEFCQDLLESNVEAFVYVEIAGGSYDQDTMGAPRENMWLETGQTWMHVLVPSGRGSRLGRVYANQLLYLFREQPISTLFMPQMSIGAGEPGQDFPNYWATTATIEWYRRDITSVPPAS